MVSDKHVSIAVGVIVLVIGGIIVTSIAGAMNEESINDEFAKAQAYCEWAYGSPEIVNARVMGEHGGWHCLANDNGPHLHQIPESQKEAAYNASRGLPHDSLLPPEEVATPTSPFGFNWSFIVLSLAFIFFLSFLAWAVRGGMPPPRLIS